MDGGMERTRQIRKIKTLLIGWIIFGLANEV